LVVVEAEEEDRVVLESLASMDREEGDGVVGGVLLDGFVP
jgi:hypothetical protein